MTDGKRIIGWRAVYTQGRKYSSKLEDGWELSTWERLPSDGVLEIMLYENHHRPDGGRLRRIMDGSDWYMMVESDAGRMMFINNDNKDNVERYYGGDEDRAKLLLKRGRWTDNETAYEAQETVWREIDF